MARLRNNWYLRIRRIMKVIKATEKLSIGGIRKKTKLEERGGHQKKNILCRSQILSQPKKVHQKTFRRPAPRFINMCCGLFEGVFPSYVELLHQLFRALQPDWIKSLDFVDFTTTQPNPFWLSHVLSILPLGLLWGEVIFSCCFSSLPPYIS